MSDEEAIFDPSLKKKKKKKKTPFSLEEPQAENPAAETTAEVQPAVTEFPDWGDQGLDKEKTTQDDLSLEAEFSLGKKKKKKKKAFNMEDLEDNLPSEKIEDADGEDKPSTTTNEDAFDFTEKKRKPKKNKVAFLDETDAMEDNIMSSTSTSHSNKWADTDRDYTYQELLTRFFDIMLEKNPDMVAGEKKRFVMRPPQIMRVGTKKSAFANFADICKLLHRQPKHLLAYLLAELGTSGSIDGSNQLIIKGRFQQKQIERVLRGYIKEYVTCHTCRSPDTILQKDTRLFFLQCETCGSRCSVASIKSGFQAVTGKRAAMRAKTA